MAKEPGDIPTSWILCIFIPIFAFKLYSEKGIDISLGILPSLFPTSINVLDCSGEENIKLAYDPRNGDLYTYNYFKEKYVLKRKTKTDSKSGCSYFYCSSRYITTKIESTYVGNDLKILETESGSRTNNAYSTDIDLTTIIRIFDANTKNKTLKGTYSHYGKTGWGSAMPQYISRKGDIACTVDKAKL